MAIFLTGSTGYLGGYLAAGLFHGHRESLNLLVRAEGVPVPMSLCVGARHAAPLPL